MKLVLFDCDGTLVDSAAFIHECMTRTFVEHDLAAPDFASTKSIIGLSLPVAMAHLGGVGEGQAMAMTASYKQHFKTRRGEADFHEPMYSGIAELLNDLSRRDEVILGIVTGKSRRGLASVLATHGLEGLFVTTRTADDCPSKPNPAMVLECCAETGIDPADTVVIGDAVVDMQMARAAGAMAIAVPWGYATVEKLTDAGAHHVLEEPKNLPGLIGGAELGAVHA